MVVPAQHLHVRLQVETGEIEVGEGVAMADVEEEVGAALVVAVLEHLDEREAQHAVVEQDGALDVAADHRHMMYATGSRRGSRRSWFEVLFGQLGAPR